MSLYEIHKNSIAHHLARAQMAYEAGDEMSAVGMLEVLFDVAVTCEDDAYYSGSECFPEAAAAQRFIGSCWTWIRDGQV